MAVAAAPALLELEAYLAALHDALADAKHGRGRLVLLTGEAGVGKTALIAHFCAEACEDVRVLTGACDALLTPRPLGPVADVAQLTGGPLERLVTTDARPHDVASALMREVAKTKPTVLVLEDLHWADEATLDVLRLLGRRIETARALVLASY